MDTRAKQVRNEHRISLRGQSVSSSPNPFVKIQPSRNNEHARNTSVLHRREVALKTLRSILVWNESARHAHTSIARASCALSRKL